MHDEVVWAEDRDRLMAAGDCAGERREVRGIEDGVERSWYREILVKVNALWSGCPTKESILVESRHWMHGNLPEASEP